MKTNELIIKLLWSDYIDLIQRGIPVYFTFTSGGVESLLNANEIAFDDAHEYINKCARDYLDVVGDHVYLKPGALSPNKSGFSAAILIICQQVLVVEEMVNSDIYSENAYFPHLRKNISNELGMFSQNPFLYQEFESIWKTLSREIYSINQSHKCVTFNFNDVKGMNKARRFPLSQALLTKEDAVRLIDAIGQSALLDENEDYVFRNIVANRSLLSSRGKNLTKHPWTRHALVNQLRSLAKNVSELNLMRAVINESTHDVSRLHLAVYPDSSDWLNLEYVVNVFDEYGDIVRSPEVVNRYFHSNVESNLYVILVPNRKSDDWILSKADYNLSPGDELIILFEANQLNSIISLVSSYFKIGGDELYKSQFTRAKKYSFIKFELGLNFDKNVFIQNGKVCISDETINKFSYQFVGGIAVNKSNDRFSSFHLPTGVLVSDKEYILQGQVKINGKQYIYEEFVKDVAEVNVEDNYEIELEEGIRLNLKVAPRYSEPSNESIFYPQCKHRLLPIATPSKNSLFIDLNPNLSFGLHKVYKELDEAKSKSDFRGISMRLEQLQK